MNLEISRFVGFQRNVMDPKSWKRPSRTYEAHRGLVSSKCGKQSGPMAAHSYSNAVIVTLAKPVMILANQRPWLSAHRLPRSRYILDLLTVAYILQHRKTDMRWSHRDCKYLEGIRYSWGCMSCLGTVSTRGALMLDVRPSTFAIVLLREIETNSKVLRISRYNAYLFLPTDSSHWCNINITRCSTMMNAYSSQSRSLLFFVWGYIHESWNEIGIEYSKCPWQ